jgi:hypothetical protein
MHLMHGTYLRVPPFRFFCVTNLIQLSHRSICHLVLFVVFGLHSVTRFRHDSTAGGLKLDIQRETVIWWFSGA